MRASQREPTPWAREDYCDYSKHLSAYAEVSDAVSNSKTNVSQGQWRGLESSSGVCRPVSGEAARSGLGARQRVAVAEHSMAELLEGQSKQSKATRKAAEQATSNHLSLPACMCLYCCARLLSLSAFFLPYSSTLIP